MICLSGAAAHSSLELNNDKANRLEESMDY